MKRKFGKVGITILYFLLLAIVLFLQTRFIDGEVNRVVVTLITFFLTLLTAVLIKVDIVLEKSIKQQDKVCSDSLLDEGNASNIVRIEDYYIAVDKMELSEREQEIGWYIYRGFTNRQIADELYIAETTVKKHASHIYEKMKVSGRKEFKQKLTNYFPGDKV